MGHVAVGKGQKAALLTRYQAFFSILEGKSQLT